MDYYWSGHHSAEGKVSFRGGVTHDFEKWRCKAIGSSTVAAGAAEVGTRAVGERVEEADALIRHMAQESDVCRRLDAIPGIGPITATALIAAIGNGAAFRKGRDFAAWVA